MRLSDKGKGLIQFYEGFRNRPYLCSAQVWTVGWGRADRQGAFDAVVSFSFNAGLGNYQRSTIRMKNNRGDFEGAADAFMAWTKGGGKELPGLVKRRKDERALFLG